MSSNDIYIHISIYVDMNIIIIQNMFLLSFHDQLSVAHFNH